MEGIVKQIENYFSISTNLCLALFVVILVLLLLNIISLVRISVLNGKYKKFMTREGSESLEGVILGQKEDILKVKEYVNEQGEKFEKLETSVLSTYSKMGLVKYDALDNMSGNLSFAFVLLNAKNDGFLMNSIHTRSGSYVYLRDIKNGICDVKLGEEENLALEKAMNY